MYKVIELVIIMVILIGLLYLIIMNKKYKKDGNITREEIIKYFKEKGATSLETGIKTKDLPKNILKNDFLMFMVKDKTLSFNKGKYYLNIK